MTGAIDGDFDAQWAAIEDYVVDGDLEALRRWRYARGDGRVFHPYSPRHVFDAMRITIASAWAAGGVGESLESYTLERDRLHALLPADGWPDPREWQLGRV